MSFPYSFVKRLESFLTTTADRLLPTPTYEYPVTSNQVSPFEASIPLSNNIDSNIKRDDVAVDPMKQNQCNSCSYTVHDTINEEEYCLWESKEACLKYYKEMLTSLQTQINELNIIPYLPCNDLQSLSKTLQRCIEGDEVDDNDLFKSITDPIFSQLDQHMEKIDMDEPQWKKILLQCMFIQSATPQVLATIASRGKDQFQQVQQMVQNTMFIKEIILSGEPKHGNYLKAFEIYNTIVNQHIIMQASKSRNSNWVHVMTNNDIFHRLALAVALEFAHPIHIFDTKTEINPISRFLHYQQAYLHGDLDPYFPTLDTWELRMIVNNDASDDEINWCRLMLRNYRPDHILKANYQWKYCMVVKTEVRYKAPEWKQFPKTYKQLISGGGKCGPRAWFGRYACKSFGIPTWGVRQPGHAAMSHWMPSLCDWVICLGGPNWKKSYWDGKKGIHFEWEMKARLCPKLFDIVCWFRCFECIENGEKVLSVENNIWYQLRLLKMRQIAYREKPLGIHLGNITSEDFPNVFVKTKIQCVEEMNTDNASRMTVHSNGDIAFQASGFIKDKGPGKEVIVMKSFHVDGGKQVHLRGDACLQYHVTIPNALESRKEGLVKYELTCRVVTVHTETSCAPLQLYIKNDIEETNYVIDIPYTEGEWMFTLPIEVQLMEGQDHTFHFFRNDTSALGLTIKDFLLHKI